MRILFLIGLNDSVVYVATYEVAGGRQPKEEREFGAYSGDKSATDSEFDFESPPDLDQRLSLLYGQRSNGNMKPFSNPFLT